MNLSNEIAALTRRLASLEASVVNKQPRQQHRLRWMILGTAVALCLLMAGTAFALTTSGEALFQFMGFTSPGATIPPLDTAVRWDRVDPPGVSRGHTNELLSLVTEASQANSFSWPLYIQLNGTNSPSATKDSSQSVGATVRAFNRSTGSPWLTGFHSEVFHGLDGVNGANVATNGTSILYNGELTTRVGSGLTIGLNLQNNEGSTAMGTHAINIQPGSRGWVNGIHFDSGATGNIGISFDSAHYNMGIDVADNSIRMNANQKLYLEHFGQVYIQYNSNSGLVEIVRNGRVVASF